ncbi:sensor histidine kinase [Clostridium lundense]|uniref:sensor histidine kinase n=1 Tax=Clostridium lundense TaxID=319475 RepID=UPI000484DC38|nr:HAMP domain-containing sensor histidine kinase [Clostridium lundense]
MKKIASLKIELVLFAVISLIISVSVFVYFVRNAKLVSDKSDKEKIEFVNSINLNYFEKDLKKIDLKDKNIYEKLDNMFIEHGVQFYIVKKDGEVVASPNKDIKNIDADKIIDGKREIINLKAGKNMAQVTGCDYLKDGCYVYFSCLGRANSDGVAVLAGIFTFIIVFTLFNLGRINYILSIKKSIKIITQGQLSHRVQLKYRNELRELAEDINYMASELEREDEKRKEFLTNISHDLRTPLTSILGYLKMIKEEKYEDEKELEGYIDKINNKSLFLKSMLDDFFQYSKLSSRDIEFNKENIYIQELIRQLVEEEEPVFQNNDLLLCSTLLKEPINIEGDGELLVRAVNNLLSNALKYSKKNTAVTIEVYKEIIEKHIFAVISISNVPKEHIDEEEIESFFERLYKKDKSRSKQGSGLGLSIVKEILKIHNGYIKGSIEDGKVVFKLFIKMHNDRFAV